MRNLTQVAVGWGGERWVVGHDLKQQPESHGGRDTTELRREWRLPNSRGNTERLTANQLIDFIMKILNHAMNDEVRYFTHLFISMSTDLKTPTVPPH